MRTVFAMIHVAVWILAGALLTVGFALSGHELAWLATLVGQAGSPNPRLLEKLRLVPVSSLVTGAELLLLAASLSFLRRRTTQLWAYRIPALPAPQVGLWLLLAGWAAIAVVSLNFGAISLGNRLRQSQRVSAAELIAADFGDDERVVCAVRETTPETAAILIKTQRPLQFLLNYELYPRRFYFYSERLAPVSAILDAWMDRRRIGWTLEVSDTGPLHFKLAPRKASY